MIEEYYCLQCDQKGVLPYHQNPVSRAFFPTFSEFAVTKLEISVSVVPDFLLICSIYIASPVHCPFICVTVFVRFLIFECQVRLGNAAISREATKIDLIHLSLCIQLYGHTDSPSGYSSTLINLPFQMWTVPCGNLNMLVWSCSVNVL